MPLSIDVLSFDDLCHVYAFLSVDDLHAVSKLGAVHSEAAQSVARRHHSSYKLNANKHRNIVKLADFCRFLGHFVRTLTIEFATEYRQDAVTTNLLVHLVTYADELTALTLVNPLETFRFAPTFLGGIRRLVIRRVTSNEKLIAAMLATSRPDTLEELTLQYMGLTGTCLRSLTGQPHTVRLSHVSNLQADEVLRLVRKHPRIHTLELDRLRCSDDSMLSLNELVEHMADVRELKLFTRGLGDFAALARLVELRSLWLTIDDNPTESYLEQFARAAGSAHQLRKLTVESHDDRLTEPMGRKLHNFRHLELLEVDVCSSAYGLDELLRGVDGHLSLKGIRLNGCQGQVLIAPEMAKVRMPTIEQLELRANLDPGLEQLARMPRLRSLTVCVQLTRLQSECEQQEYANRFLRAVAETNRLAHLHVRFNLTCTLKLQPATEMALKSLTSLLDLTVSSRCTMHTVRTMLANLSSLRTFVNFACGPDVLDNKDELRRMRPEMRLVHFSVHSKGVSRRAKGAF